MADETPHSLPTTLRYIERDISEMKDDLKDLKGQYVTKEEFEPVKKLVYGVTTLILSSVVLALIGLVIINTR